MQNESGGSPLNSVDLNNISKLGLLELGAISQLHRVLLFIQGNATNYRPLRLRRCVGYRT